jgi:hypothetical protein
MAGRYYRGKGDAAMGWKIGGPIGHFWEHTVKPIVKGAEGVVQGSIDTQLFVPRIVLKGLEGKDGVRSELDRLRSDERKIVKGAVHLANAKRELERQLADRVGGNEAVKVVNDIERMTSPIPPEDAAETIQCIIEFLLTGNIKYLNPIYVICAGEILKARNDYWDRARPLDVSVRKAMPASISAEVNGARAISVDSVSSLSIAKFAIDHFAKASAITLIDLIFFKEIPAVDTNEQKHYWAHELYHVHQYKSLGIEKFIMTYLENFFGFHAPGWVHPMEREADEFACKNFWIAHPYYIQACPT